MPDTRHVFFNAPVPHRKRGKAPFPVGVGAFPGIVKPGKGKKGDMSIKENRFTRVDEAVFVHGHTHSLFTWTGWWNGRQN